MPIINGLVYSLYEGVAWSQKKENDEVKKELGIDTAANISETTFSKDIPAFYAEKDRTAYLNCFKIENEFFVIPHQYNLTFHQVGKTLKNLEILNLNSDKTATLPFKITIPSKTPPEKIIGIIKAAKTANDLGLKTDTVLELDAYCKKLNEKSSNPKSRMTLLSHSTKHLNLSYASRLLELINNNELTPSVKLEQAKAIKEKIDYQKFPERSFALKALSGEIVKGLEEKVNPKDKSREKKGFSSSG
jgi:hypothetical protein